MRKKRFRISVAMLCLIIGLTGCSGQSEEKQVSKQVSEELSVTPSRKPDGSKYRIAYVDYDEYLPASQQLYYILSGLRNMGWITCDEFPFTSDSMTTKEMIGELSRMNLGDYIEFDEDAFYYLAYSEESEVIQALRKHVEEDGDIDMVLTFGTSAGKLVRDMELPVPMVDFSATDPVASGIIDSATEGSGRDMVWAQVEPSMPPRQLKYYHSICPFEKLGIVVYGDETISGVSGIEKVRDEVGFELVKHQIPETERSTPKEKAAYYGEVRRQFEQLCEEGIDAFFLTVDLINDMEQLRELLQIFYDKKIPVYVMDDISTVENGALMIISTYDFENVGYFIADAIAKILNGAVAGKLPCVYTSSPYICFNYDVAREIGYPLDFQFLISCDEIYHSKEVEGE